MLLRAAWVVFVFVVRVRVLSGGRKVKKNVDQLIEKIHRMRDAKINTVSVLPSQYIALYKHYAKSELTKSFRDDKTRMSSYIANQLGVKINILSSSYRT